LCADTHPGAYSGQDAYTGRIIPSLYESHPNDSRVTGPVEQCPTVSAKWVTGGNNTPLVTDGGTHFRKSKRAQSVNDDETWVESDVTNTMNVFDQGDVRATDVVVQPGEASAQLHMIAQSDFVQPFAQNQLGEVRAGEVFNTINTNSNANGRNTPLVQTAMHVRRLTPVECERLQGFPDGWTDIRPGGKDTPDSPRYKALGNSMAVPVMRWIGERIAKASRG
jgi:DNA (cytosine-5)-methyltransferase 1